MTEIDIKIVTEGGIFDKQIKDILKENLVNTGHNTFTHVKREDIYISKFIDKIPYEDYGDKQ
jgi:hypothetical protein